MLPPFFLGSSLSLCSLTAQGKNVEGCKYNKENVGSIWPQVIWVLMKNRGHELLDCKFFCTGIFFFSFNMDFALDQHELKRGGL